VQGQSENDGDATDLFRAGGVNSIGPHGTSNGAAFPNTGIYQNGNIRCSGVTISGIGPLDASMRLVVRVGSSSSSTKKSKKNKSPKSKAPKSNKKAKLQKAKRKARLQKHQKVQVNLRIRQTKAKQRLVQLIQIQCRILL